MTFFVSFAEMTTPPMSYIPLQNTADIETVILPRTDDGASSVIRIPKPLPIGASLHNTVYVCMFRLHHQKFTM